MTESYAPPIPCCNCPNSRCVYELGEVLISSVERGEETEAQQALTLEWLKGECYQVTGPERGVA